MSEPFPVLVDAERVAQLIAHRACCGTEHDPANGKLHGNCVVCGVPWPCEYAGKPPLAARPQEQASQPPEAQDRLATDCIESCIGTLLPDAGKYIEALDMDEAEKRITPAINLYLERAFQRGEQSMAEKAAQACEARVDRDHYRHGNREAEQCAIAIRSLAGSAMLGTATTTSTQAHEVRAQAHNFNEWWNTYSNSVEYHDEHYAYHEDIAEAAWNAALAATNTAKHSPTLRVQP